MEGIIDKAVEGLNQDQVLRRVSYMYISLEIEAINTDNKERPLLAVSGP